MAKNSMILKRRLDLKEEFLEPTEKVISDGDLLVKSLSEKQLNKCVNLKESLTNPKLFRKGTELSLITNHISGVQSLQGIKSNIHFSEILEPLKRVDLSKNDIELIVDYNYNGMEYVESKHKNINKTVLHNRINQLLNCIKACNTDEDSNPKEIERHKSEFGLSIKPKSAETKLLQFALQCSSKLVDHISPLDPINHIQELAETFTENANKGLIPKASKRRRILRKNSHHTSTLQSMKSSLDKTVDFPQTQWDQKETKQLLKPKNDTKLYTCKSECFYTVRDGQIVSINEMQLKQSSSDNSFQKRFSLEEIKAIPKFMNYKIGEPSKIIYIKNIHNSTTEEELCNLFKEYQNRNAVKSIKLMKGKMRGQAFVSLLSIQDAVQALNELNGAVIRNKPIIMQYGNKDCP